MELIDKIKKYENFHIVLWLLKDTCWMLELRWLGASIMVPTLLFAFYIVNKTSKSADFYINLAIFFWIFANSFWMMTEFFFQNQFKYFSIIPFSLGFVFVAVFYWKAFLTKRLNS